LAKMIAKYAPSGADWRVFRLLCYTQLYSTLA